MPVYVTPTRPEELYHWGLAKGEKSKNHKYVARVEDGTNPDGTTNYRYFYTTEEYNAYLVGDKDAGTSKKSSNPISTLKKDVSTVKTAFSDDNMYYVKSKNYNEKKKAIQNTKEWQDILKDKNSEYRKKDSNGKIYYDYDQYLVDKKHPILDALTDYGYGRKISIRKQSLTTLAAGVKDYVKMAESTIETVAGLSVALLTAKIKNQQGSYKNQKKAIKKKISQIQSLLSSDSGSSAIDTATKIAKNYASDDDTSKLISDVSDSAKEALKTGDTSKLVDSTSKAVSDYANSDSGKAAISKAKSLVDDYVDNNSAAKSAINSYAKSKGITYDEAKEQMYNLPTETLNKYKSGELSTDDVIKAAEDYANSDEGKAQLAKAKDTVSTYSKNLVDSYVDSNDEAKAALNSYAKSKGITYDEAKEQMYNLPESTLKKYASGDLSTDDLMDAVKEYANSDEGKEQISNASSKATKKMVDSFVDNNENAQYALRSYANSKGISYDDAKSALYNIPYSTLKKYASGDLTSDDIMKEVDSYYKSDEGQKQLKKAKESAKAKAAEKAKETVENKVTKETKEFMSKHPTETSTAVYYYAKEHNMTEEEAREALQNLPLSTLKRYID